MDTVWTTTERPGRIGIGWLFPSTQATASEDTVELACVPFIEAADGSLQPMFEVLADQRQKFSQLMVGHGLDYTVMQQPSATTTRQPGRQARAPMHLRRSRQEP